MAKTDPPASPVRPAYPITRRNLFRLGGLAAATAATPLAAHGFGSGFTHGVASGEPGPDRVLLWTRYVAGQDTRLTWEVSDSIDFSQIAAAGETVASPAHDSCAKAWAEGLGPARWYYYRFIAPDGSRSDVGRTRTLPESDVERFRMAVFSCSNFGFGWFNAYAHAAEANDVDLALHLGDYLYEYERAVYPAAYEANPDRVLWPASELVALADYRLRYATYRNDPDLRRIHQLLPMISVWDDHETANDSWKGGAENHQSDTEGSWDARKTAAIQAYREWLPVSDETYAEYRIGKLATLLRLETRLTARDKQFNLAEVIRGKQTPEETLAALQAFRAGDFLAPEREILGAEQQAWVAARLAASRRDGTVWQVLVQQILMGEVYTAPELAEAIPSDAPDYVRRRAQASVMAGRAGLPANMDMWDGYPAARERLFEAALAADANLVSLAGDTHNAWAFDLTHKGQPVGVEFGGHSVTSPGLESYLGAIAPQRLARVMVRNNDGLKFVDTSQRGYMMVELTPDAALSEYRFMATVRQRSSALAGSYRVVSRAGARILSA